MAPNRHLIVILLSLIALPCLAGMIINPYIFATAGGGGPPAYVSGNGAASSSGGTSASVSITPSGSNRYLLVAINSYGVSSNPSSVVFNTSESLTLLNGGQFFDSGGRFSVWRLINPTATTANVVVTFGGTVVEYSIAVAVYSGVNQTTPESTVLSDYSTSSDKTLTPSTSTDDLGIAACGYNASFSVTDYQTTRLDYSVASYDGVMISDGTASSPTTTLRYDTNANPVTINLPMVAFGLNP